MGEQPPDRHLTIEEHARHCAALIAHLGLDRVHYVGHSSSCLIGLQLTLDHPELVRSLTLLEPAPGGALHGPADMDFVRRVVVPAMGAFTSGDLTGAFDMFMTGVGGADHRRILEDGLGIEGYRRAVRESAFYFADEVRAVQEWRFGEAEAGRISQPMLVVEGGDSHRLGPLNSEVVGTLAGLLPHAETELVGGVNHMMPLQDPDAVGRVIADFVRRHTTGSTPALTLMGRGDRQDVEPAAL
ncbi:MAG: alpha/beta hydrolase [Chloroflexi bacterium]|nr:alpha/beta hydrolase [Chloroflexota bacterium]